MRRSVSLVFCVLLAALSVLLIREWTLLPDGRTHVYFLDVGQGDSALIVTPSGRTIVIDGGPDWSTLRALGRYRSFFRRSIDVLVLSHSDLDHVASVPELLARDTIGALIISATHPPAAWMERTIQTAAERRTPILRVHAGQRIDLGEGMFFDIVWPPPRVDATFLRGANHTSIVARLTSSSGSVLFTGDIEERTERTLVASGIDLSATILKVPHHGSLTSSSTGFLLAVSPKVAVISAGIDNPYGHPRPAIVHRYAALGIPLHRTDTEGTIDIVLGREGSSTQE